jgi:hypothetical protein
MTTPFDTTRLDEECERVANEIQESRIFRYDPIFNHEVRDVLLGKPHNDEWDDEQWRVFAVAVYNRCRRPKMVPA